MLKMLIYKTQIEMLNSNWISSCSWGKIRLPKESKEKGAKENLGQLIFLQGKNKKEVESAN